MRDWAKEKEFAAQCDVKILEKGATADTLYFVDSVSSYDDNIQEIARRTAKILNRAGVDFGILGKAEKRQCQRGDSIWRGDAFSGFERTEHRSHTGIRC